MNIWKCDSCGDVIQDFANVRQIKVSVLQKPKKSEAVTFGENVERHICTNKCWAKVVEILRLQSE